LDIWPSSLSEKLRMSLTPDPVVVGGTCKYYQSRLEIMSY
jgi:hypothetical protein